MAAAAVVSRSSFLPPSFGTLWSRNPERPADGLDRTGRAANTDVNCIPSRGKSQFCLESAMSEGEGRASSESNHLARSSSSLEPRSWQCKSFSLSSAAATDHASIFNHFADGGAEFENLDSNIDGIERRNGGGVFNSFVVVGCRAFLHPSFHRISPSFCPIDSGHLTLSSSDSESRDRPTNDAAAAAALCSVGFAPKVIESCAANIQPQTIKCGGRSIYALPQSIK